MTFFSTLTADLDPPMRYEMLRTHFGVLHFTQIAWAKPLLKLGGSS